MRRRTTMRMFLGGFTVALLLAGCGGGGGGSAGVEAPGLTPAGGVPPAGPVTVLTWDPPSSFADNERVDPYRDIDHYEVYVREDADFSNSDLPVVVIPALTSVDPTRAPSTGVKKGGRPNSEFQLKRGKNDSQEREEMDLDHLSRSGSPGGGSPPENGDGFMLRKRA